MDRARTTQETADLLRKVQVPEDRTDDFGLGLVQGLNAGLNNTISALEQQTEKSAYAAVMQQMALNMRQAYHHLSSSVNSGMSPASRAKTQGKAKGYQEVAEMVWDAYSVGVAHYRSLYAIDKP